MSDQPAANRRIFLLSAVVFAALFADAKAQTLAVPLAEPTAGVERLDTVEVVAALQPAEDGPFLPDVEGAQIFAGKKTDNIDPNLLPQINNNNYRQVLATTPGMVLAEESTPLVSIGSRGFDPHRMQFMQVLKDGIPIHADMIGYPEAYYTPPIDAVDRIELVRGGAALLYGPQPGGVVNYLTEKPPTDTPFRLRSLNTIGSFNYYANFSEIGGTVGNLGYYGYYNHRQTDGFRAANSQFNLNSWSGTLSWGQQTTARTYLTIDAYDETHGEPGGVTLATGPGTVNWNSDTYGTSRFYDNMRISRYAVQLIHENDLSDTTFFSLRAWWNYYLRYSARQRGGGFGTLPTGKDANSNQIENQQFYTFGFEPRIRHDWEWLGNTHTFTGGMLLFNTFSPRTDQRGSTPWATTGVTRNQSNRSNWYYSVFAENRFAIGNLSIVPPAKPWPTSRTTTSSRSSASARNTTSPRRSMPTPTSRRLTAPPFSAKRSRPRRMFSSRATSSRASSGITKPASAATRSRGSPGTPASSSSTSKTKSEPRSSVAIPSSSIPAARSPTAGTACCRLISSASPMLSATAPKGRPAGSIPTVRSWATSA